MDPLLQSNSTVRVSLGWMLFGLLLVFALGMAGGVVGTRLATPPLPPLTEGTNQIITTTQEVTISPSMAAAALVDRHERSVMLLADATKAVGTGIVITNDGVIVSTRNITGDAAYIFDNNGQKFAVTKMGTDELYGLTYYRLQESVIPPFEMANENPGIGSTLLALSRSADTAHPKADSWKLQEYIIPTPPASIGWQRIARFNPAADEALAGSPLLTDEGKLSAIIINPRQGTAIPVTIIRASLDRLSANKLATNPFETWGIGLTYQFQDNEDNTKREFAASIASVTPNSPAAQSGLRAGDVLVAINDTQVEWTSNIAKMLEKNGDPVLTMLRSGQQRTATLTTP